MNKLICISFLAAVSFSASAMLPKNLLSKYAKNASAKGELANMNLDRFIKSSPKDSQKLLLQMDLKAILEKKNGIIRVNQAYEGLEVYGSQIAYNIQNGDITSRDGRIASIELDSIMPNLSEKQAIDLVHNEIETTAKLEASLKVLPLKNSAHLVWHIIENGFDSRWNYFIDAQDGDIIDNFQALTTGSGKLSSGKYVFFKSKRKKLFKEYTMEVAGKYARATYNAKEERVLPGDIAVSKLNHWKDPSLIDAHVYAGQFSKLLLKKFKRSSFDDQGTPIVSTVHFGKSYINAFWNGTQMVYGDGGTIPGRNGNPDIVVAPLAGAFDVVAHEVSHAITSSSSNLRYRNESGALNEAFSDIMATYAEFKMQPKQADWMLGEDVWDMDNEGTALRYMNNPTIDGSSYDYYPERYIGWWDNGGVHVNSGIANLMFYLLSEGGSHPRQKTDVEVDGIGVDKAIQYVYKAFTQKLIHSSKFSDARSAMIKIAEEESAPENEIEAIKAAWSAVGVE